MLLLTCEKLTWKKAEVTNWYHWGRQSCSQQQIASSRPSAEENAGLKWWHKSAGGGPHARWGALMGCWWWSCMVLCGLLLVLPVIAMMQALLVDMFAGLPVPPQQLLPAQQML